MKSVADIVEAVGVKRLAERLGVQTTAVHNAKDAGVFPARYFRVIAEEAGVHGVDIEGASFLDLFSFAPGKRASFEATKSNEVTVR